MRKKFELYYKYYNEKQSLTNFCLGRIFIESKVHGQRSALIHFPKPLSTNPSGQEQPGIQTSGILH